MFWYSVVLCLLFLFFDDVVTQPFTCVPLVVGQKVEDTSALDELHSNIEPNPSGDKSEETESDDEERGVFLDYLRFANDIQRMGGRVGEIAPAEIRGRFYEGGSDPLRRELRREPVGGVRKSVTPPGWKAAQDLPGIFDEKTEQVRESILGLSSHRHPELRLRRNTMVRTLSTDDIPPTQPPKLEPPRRRPSHLTLDFTGLRSRSIFSGVDSPDDALSFSPITPEVGGVGASGTNAGTRQSALLDLIVERLSPVEDSSRKSLAVITEEPYENVAVGHENSESGAAAIAQGKTAGAVVPTKEVKSQVSGFKRLLPSNVFGRGKSEHRKRDSNGNWGSRLFFRGKRRSVMFPEVRKGVRLSLPSVVSDEVSSALANKGLVTRQVSRAEGEGGKKRQGSLTSTLDEESVPPTTPPELGGDDSPKPVHGNSADEELKGNESPGSGRRNSVDEELKRNESPRFSRRNIADEESQGKKKLEPVHPNSVDPEPNEGEGTILRGSQLEKEPEGEISQPPAGDSSSQNNQVEASPQEGSPNNSSKWPRLSRYFHVASRIVPILLIVGLVTAGFALLGVWLHKKKKRKALFKKASKRSNAVLQQRIKMRSEAELQNLANT